MKTTVFSVFVAVLIFASAMAHGLLGWPAFRSPLEKAEVDPDVIAALAIGWYFGSAAMLGFAAIVFCQAVRFCRHRKTGSTTLWAIAFMYMTFGTVACVSRNYNTHFLLFVVTGILVGLFAFFASSRRRRQITDMSSSG